MFGRLSRAVGGLCKMFRRRLPQHWVYRLRQFLWPRTGWMRAAKYTWHRTVRIKGSADSIALGLAVGAFISASPFLGLHLVLAAAIAWVIGGNIIASAVGTWVGNPISFPFIWLATFKLGHFIMGTTGHVSSLDMLSLETLLSHPMDMFEPVILPMAIGGLPIGVIMAVATYYPCRTLIGLYQARRSAVKARFEALRRHDRKPS